MIVKKLKNCKLIISGDFNQLDVINDLQKYNYKDSSILKELCDNNVMKVSNCRCANNIIFNLIQFISSGKSKIVVWIWEFISCIYIP